MKKVFNIVAAALSVIILAFVAGCSNVQETSAVHVLMNSVDYGRVALSLPKAGGNDVLLSDIRLYGTKEGEKTTLLGSWDNSAALKADSNLKIPVGKYSFKFVATYDGSTFSGTCEGTVTVNTVAKLSFTLTRQVLSDWGDDDAGDETNEDGELLPVEPSPEGLVEFTSFNANDLTNSSETFTSKTQRHNLIIDATAESNVAASPKQFTIGSVKYTKRLQFNGSSALVIYVGANRKGTLQITGKSGSSTDDGRTFNANGVAIGKAPVEAAVVSGAAKGDEDGYIRITSSSGSVYIMGLTWVSGNGGAGGVDKINVSEAQLPVIDNSEFAPTYKNGKKVGMRSNIRDINTDQIEVKLFVAPSGSPDGDGTKSKPLDLQTAINQIPAGGAIVMKSGKYRLSSTVKVSYDNCGTESARKYILPETGGAVLLDFSSQPTDSANRGFALDGSYWHIYGVTCYNAGDNGMYVTGKNNIVERCVFQANQDTGLQIARRSSDLSDKKDWPANNLILNCTSFDNKDDATGENADGFASKLTCGDGNVFDGCISFANCDDGWDLYAKPATGPIGVVTIRNCVALQNGKTTTGTNYANGDMNGFKLGGSSNACPTPHIVQNSVAFLNGKDGFTDNGNGGALNVSNCSSYGNINSNFNFYRTFAGGVFKNLISMVGSNAAPAQVDKFGGKASECTVQATAEKVLYIGAKKSSSNTGFYFADEKTVIGNGDKIGAGNFKDPFSTEMKNTTPPKLDLNIDATCRNTDGTVNLAGFLEAKEGSVYQNMGAHFGDEAETVFDCGL